MAIRKFSRRTRARTQSKPASNSTSAKPAARIAKTVVVAESDVQMIALRLQYLRAVIVMATAALWHQNADLDGEIGTALQRAVADPMLTEIDRLEALISKCPRTRY